MISFVGLGRLSSSLRWREDWLLSSEPESELLSLSEDDEELDELVDTPDAEESFLDLAV